MVQRLFQNSVSLERADFNSQLAQVLSKEALKAAAFTELFGQPQAIAKPISKKKPTFEIGSPSLEITQASVKGLDRERRADVRSLSMIIELFSLCDYAQDAFGKLTIVGAFDSLMVREIPTVYPLIAIAARVRFAVYELGEHRVKVEIRDPDSEETLVPPLEQKIKLNAIGNDSAVSNIVLHLGAIRINREARWKITLFIDDEERASLPFNVKKAVPPPHGFQRN